MAIFADFFNAGNVPEDVINILFDISPLDRPFTGTIAHISSQSAIKEWLDHALATPNKDNAIIDGADAVNDSTSQGTRYRQPMQLTERGIQLGDQASNSDGFDNVTQFEKQLEYRVNETYRDQEAAALSENASVIGTSGTAAKQAGFFAQCKTATSFGATGADGGWNSGTGVFDAPTAGTTRPLSEGDILSVAATCNTNGGRPDRMTLIPALKTKFSQYMMTSSSRVGVLVTQAPSGQGGASAVQGVMSYETDFGLWEILNNQIMQPEAATRTNVCIFQTSMAECCDQWTARAKRLGPTGAGEKWQVTSSFGILLLNEQAHAAVRDVNQTVDMTA